MYRATWATMVREKPMKKSKDAKMSNSTSTLRGLIESTGDSEYKRRFEEAEQLAKSIMSENSSYIPLPHFTKHDLSHCEAVERNLNQMIWGGGRLGQRDFDPTPEEAMYLLSAAWMHDLGMWYGILDGEDINAPPDYEGAEVLRDEHEDRAVTFIHEKWRMNCGWNENQKTRLSSICAFHRRRHSISDFDPVSEIGDHRKPIRLVVLAALLRVGDACHEDQSRAPASLRALYISLGMPREARNHWETANLIKGIELDHKSKSINVVGNCPPAHNYGLGEFDLAEVVEIVRQNIENELRSVQQVLLPYSNTYFGWVKRIVHRPFHLRHKKESRYLALWPYLLDKPRGSTEAAAALAQMLLFIIEEGEKNNELVEAWKNRALTIMEETQKSRPGDFVIRNLCHGAKKLLLPLPDDARSAEAITKYLEDFGNRISDDCHKMAELAQDKGLVGPDDVIAVHGYCANIAKFLESLASRSKFHNPIYIVDCQEPVGKVLLGPSQNDRMLSFADKLGFSEAPLIRVDALPQVLDKLGQRRCKVLIGVHGVLKQGEMTDGFICKVGSYVLANTSRRFGGEVIVFAETTKILDYRNSLDDIGGPAGLFSVKRINGSPFKGTEILHLVPDLDFVPSDFVDLVVTERGVFPPDEILVHKEPTGNHQARDKKESNPT